MSTIAAIYCRVSTEDQEREGTSLDTQESICRAKALALGYELPAQYVFREAASGLTTNRTALTELRRLAEQGKVKAIVVLKPDRLARNGEDILALFKEFKINGAKLVFVKEEFEDSPVGKMIAFALGWAAEMYVHATKEATKRGKAARMAEGQIAQGTGPGIYGYSWDKLNKRRLIDDCQAATVQTIFDIISQGKDCFTVARDLNLRGVPAFKGGLWHARTIRNIATNPAYRGLTYYGRTRREGRKTIRLPESEWKTIPGATPAIVSEELFNRANEALNRPKARTGKVKYDPYLLSGHMTCAECGSPVTGSCLMKGRYRYYRCRGTTPTNTRGAICKSKYINAEELEAAIWEKVKAVLMHPDVHVRMLKAQNEAILNGGNVDSLEKQIRTLEGRVKTYKGQHERLIDLFTLDEFDKDTLLDKMNRVKLSRANDECELASLKLTLSQLHETEKVELALPDFCADIIPRIENCTFDDKRTAFAILKLKGLARDGQVDFKTVVPFKVLQSYDHWTNIGMTTWT